MDIRQLQQMGAFNPRSLIPKTIKVRYPAPLPAEKWAEPSVPEFAAEPEMVDGALDVFIRKRSASDFLEIASAPDREKACFLILRCVCDAEGAATFPDYATVDRLEDWLFIPLLIAVNEVNNSGPKRSPRTTSSGATSRSRSGGERSPNGKKPSRQTSGEPGPSTPPSTGA